MGFRKPSKKFVIISSLVIVVVAVVAFSMVGSGNNHVSVQADLAYRDDITELITASGRIEPQTKVNITSEVSAQIQAVYVKEGDQVSIGQPLLQLDTIQYESDVKQARYSLDELTALAEASRAKAEQDELEFQRQDRLFKQKLTSETAFTDARFAAENSQANYRAMQAQVKTGRARLEKAEDNLTKTRIVAPMDGVITFLQAEVGEIAQAQTSFTQGQTLMTIADLSVYEVEVDVDETEIARVHIGQDADIRVDAFRDSVFAGRVVEIGNSAKVKGEGTESYATSFRVKIRFIEADELIRPGMSASVDIEAAAEKDAVLIPYASVVTREFHVDSLPSKIAAAKADSSAPVAESASSGEVIAASVSEDDSVQPVTAESRKTRGRRGEERVRIPGVFIVDNGVVKFVEVETGIADDRNIVVASGVEPGDTVVSGSFQTLRKLSDGEAVSIEESSMDRIRDESN